MMWNHKNSWFSLSR